MKKFFKQLINLPKNIIVMLINVYQFLLSPDHSWLRARFPYGYCRHYPSCSQYSKEAVIKFGLIKGLYLSLKRLSKCHPWAEPSVDLVPKS